MPMNRIITLIGKITKSIGYATLNANKIRIVIPILKKKPNNAET